VGILGMAFKGESDDTRFSLAYKLKHVLQFRCESVICADDNVSTDPHLIPESDLLNSADLVFIGAPHRRYKSASTTAPVVDIWNIRGNGVLI
jgi:UDP-N-acetyl-D-mannosaminuronic acid dehydrogenase